MKVTLDKNNNTVCQLNKAERQKIRNAVGVVMELAHHFRDTEFGDRSSECESILRSILIDKELTGKTETGPFDTMKVV